VLDRDVVSRRMTERILRHSRPIAAHVCAAQMQDAHFESFNAANLAFDIGYGGHCASSLIQLNTLVNKALRLGSDTPSRVLITFAPLRETFFRGSRKDANEITEGAKEEALVRRSFIPVLEFK
jgi:hypothetical protein